MHVRTVSEVVSGGLFGTHAETGPFREVLESDASPPDASPPDARDDEDGGGMPHWGRTILSVLADASLGTAAERIARVRAIVWAIDPDTPPEKPAEKPAAESHYDRLRRETTPDPKRFSNELRGVSADFDPEAFRRSLSFDF